MKKIFLNVSNHNMTADQIAEITKYGMEVMELPENIKVAWGQLDPTSIPYIVNDIWNYVNLIQSQKAVITGLVKEPVKIEAALVAGQPGAVYQLTQNLIKMYIKVFYAHTKRVSVEKEVNGEVVKTNVFKHEGFYSMTNNVPFKEYFETQEWM